jgi:hypothetical protein
MAFLRLHRYLWILPRRLIGELCLLGRQFRARKEQRSPTRSSWAGIQTMTETVKPIYSILVPRWKDHGRKDSQVIYEIHWQKNLLRWMSWWAHPPPPHYILIQLTDESIRLKCSRLSGRNLPMGVRLAIPTPHGGTVIQRIDKGEQTKTMCWKETQLWRSIKTETKWLGWSWWSRSS